MVSPLKPPPVGADLIVIGDGLIGLSTALALAQARAKVLLIGKPETGAASTAAAGLLIPAFDRLPAAAHAFFQDSLDRYPAFVESLREHDATLSILQGIVERRDAGDVLRERDGAIDNVRLVDALRAAVAMSGFGRISLVRDLVAELQISKDGVRGRTRGGRGLSANQIVLAAGAWTPEIRGLPRPLPIRPLKGQMIALGANVLDRAMMNDDVYLVPRGDETLVGATVEEAGFDVTVTDDAIESLRANAVALCPELAKAPITRSWAGTRPATPDMLPIIGPDPEHEHVVYACGHSKNGVLLAPATAAAVVELLRRRPTPTPIDAFSVTRFS
jgi:glycine oxidase